MKTRKALALIMTLMFVVFAFTGCLSNNAAPESSGSGESTESTMTLSPDATNEEIEAFITQKSDNPDKIVLSYCSTTADLHTQAYMKGFRQFLILIKERCGDRIEIRLLLNGTAGTSADAVLGGLQNQTIEMSDWPLASFAEFTNAFTPLDVPYLVTSIDDMQALLMGPAGDYMKEKCLEDTGLRVIFTSILGAREMTNSKHPIETVEDMKGLKFRVQPNQLHMAGMKAMGANPTNIAFAELFTALQQGTVDGQENPADTIYNMQYYEVQKYMSTTDHIIAGGCLVMNDEFFNAMPEDMQQIFLESGKEASEYVITDLDTSLDEVYKNLEEKMEVTYLSDEAKKGFQDAVKKAWPEMRELVGAEHFDKVLELAGIEY